MWNLLIWCRVSSSTVCDKASSARYRNMPDRTKLTPFSRRDSGLFAVRIVKLD